MVGLRYFKNQRKFIIHSFALHRRHANLARDLLAVAIGFQDIFGLAPHGRDNVTRAGEDGVNQFVVPRCNLPPCRVAVPLAAVRYFALHVEQSTLARPSMGKTVENQNVITRFFCLLDKGKVFLHLVGWLNGGNVILSKVAVQFRAAVFGVDDGNLPAKPEGQLERRHGFAAAGRATKPDSRFRLLPFRSLKTHILPLFLFSESADWFPAPGAPP